jgi:hypothetical protein
MLFVNTRGSKGSVFVIFFVELWIVASCMYIQSISHCLEAVGDDFHILEEEFLRGFSITDGYI